MGNKKTNPNRKPATQADVNKAYERGLKEGLNRAAAFFLSVMRDRFDASPEECDRIWQAINERAESINERYARLQDFEKALLDEDGILLCQTKEEGLRRIGLNEPCNPHSAIHGIK